MNELTAKEARTIQQRAKQETEDGYKEQLAKIYPLINREAEKGFDTVYLSHQEHKIGQLAIEKLTDQGYIVEAVGANYSISWK